MQGRIYDPAIGRFISADPYVQYPLWSQGLNRYSYGFNNPMSGSDPTGFSWFNDAFSDSSGWELAGAVGGFGSIVTAGAYLSGNGGSAAAGASGGNEVGGALGLANAIAGLSDPGANQSFAEPMGELGSGAEFGEGSGLYNEGAGAAPARTGGRLAQAGGQDVLGPFVVTGSQGADLRPRQFEGWEFLPTLNFGVGGNVMVPFASFFPSLTGGIGGGGQAYGIFLDFSRGTVGLYERSDVRIPTKRLPSWSPQNMLGSCAERDSGQTQ